MKTPKFTTQLAKPMSAGWCGFGSSGSIDPDKWADELFKGEIAGPILTCYMLRRFGWPNTGTDDHKELMGWNLTTPMPGLCLYVSPYLGHMQAKFTEEEFKQNSGWGTGNMHFGLRHDKKVGDGIRSEPGRDAYFQRKYKAIWKWWRTTGTKLYAWGFGLEQGDEDELIHKWSDAKMKDPKETRKFVCGLWKRTESVKGKRALPKTLQMAEWWLEELLKERHPEVVLPKPRKSEAWKRGKLTKFQIQVRAAIRATLKDLLRPTNVRDINFTPFGDIERCPRAIERYKNQPHADGWEGKGYTPQYFYSKEGQRDVAKERAERAKRRGES